VSAAGGFTIDGSFSYDANTNTYSAVQIDSLYYPFISYSDTFLPPFVLENGLANDNTASGLAAWTIYDAYGYFTLQLDFATALTNAGGNISILPTSREAVTGGIAGTSEIYIVSGSVSAVPIPAAVWLFVSAIAATGFLRRRI